MNETATKTPVRPASYDDDILGWAEQQAALLRSLAGSSLNLPKGLDLAHIAEEIEDVGKSEFYAVQSLIGQILIHLIKSASAISATPLRHWRSELLAFSSGLRKRYAPSMRARIDMDRLWQEALDQAAAELSIRHETLLPDLPDACPVEVEDLVAGDIDAAIARVQHAARAGATSLPEP